MKPIVKILIRCISVLGYLFCFTIIWILIPSFLRLLGWKSIWFFSRNASKMGLLFFGVRVQIKGLEELNGQESMMFMANHSSWFDQMALCTVLPLQLHFLANQKYFSTPVLKYAMKLYQHIPVYHDRAKKISAEDLSKMQYYIQQGDSIVVFPESTRSISDELYPFKTGMFLQAAKMNLKVVPIHILGAKEIYPRKEKFWKIKSGLITVIVRPTMQMHLHHWQQQAVEFEQKFIIEHQKMKKEYCFER